MGSSVSKNDKRFLEAVTKSDINAVEQVFKSVKNLDLNKLYDGKAALHIAVMQKDAKMTAYLLDKKANAMIKDSDGHTIMHLAAREGDREIVEVLLTKTEYKKYINEVSKDGNTALHYATSAGKSKVVLMLLKSSADVNCQAPPSHLTPLHLACAHDYKRIATLLTKYGADPSLKNVDGETAEELQKSVVSPESDPLLASVSGPMHKMEYVIVQDLVKSNCYSSASMQAAKFIKRVNQGDTDGVKDLISKGLDINVVGSDKRGAVHAACFAGNVKMLDFLISKGGNPNAADIRGNTALHTLIEGAALEDDITPYEACIHFLIDKQKRVKVKINALNMEHFTPTLLSVRYNLVPLAEALILYGGDAVSGDKRSFCGSHYAARHKNPRMLKLLLKSNQVSKLLNAQDKVEFQTPLHVAVNKCNKDAVALLLDAGADISLEDDGGCTALDWAQARADDCKEVFDMLKAVYTKKAKTNNNAPKGPTKPDATITELEKKLSEQALVIYVNQLQLQDPIGEGTFGTVYKAEWVGTQVAVKKIKLNKESSEYVTFLKEVIAISKLRHPNIITFLGTSIESPEIHFVAEFMSRGSLAQQLKKLRLPDIKMRVVSAVARGMAYIHSMGVTHKSLKCENILISQNWDVKISDFGLSCIQNANFEAKSCRAYCAPELLSGKQESEKIDVYAFGILMWEIWTKDRAPACSDKDVIHGARPPVPMDAPGKYAELMQACWEGSPSKRLDFTAVLALTNDMHKELNNLKDKDFESMQETQKKLLRNYEIDFKELEFKKELGTGLYGKLYQGKWRETKVTIKQCTGVIGEQQVERFKKEIETMVYVNLRCGLHANFRQMPNLCIVMEQLTCTLEEFIRSSSPIPVVKQIELVAGIASGMYHLACQDIVHRDLSAASIMLDFHDAPKVTDFGLARCLTPEESHIQTHSGVAYIRWMAPESLARNEYSQKSDVWSFGIVVWEIVSNEKPHADLSVRDAVMMIEEGHHPSIPEDCYTLLQQIMEKCWQKDPADRPSFQKICQALKSFKEKIAT